MLTEEFESMMIDINDTTICLRSIFDQIDRLLSSNNKNFTVTIKNKRFEFYPATTKLESRQLQRNRHKVIRLLLSYAFKHYISLMPVTNPDDLQWTHCFRDLLAFTKGADPKDHQFEKVDMESYEVTDEHGEKIKSIPLEQDSYHMVQERKSEQESQQDAENIKRLFEKGDGYVQATENMDS